MSYHAHPDTLNGRTEHGIWSDYAGGFVLSSIYTIAGAVDGIEWMIAQGEEPRDLKVRAFCETHRDEEVPADECDICNWEDEGE